MSTLEKWIAWRAQLPKGCFTIAESNAMSVPDELLTIEANILFARKIAHRYEQQNMLDDPNYADILRLIETLEQKYALLLCLQNSGMTEPGSADISSA